MKYAIWSSFSLEARRAAATADYCSGRVTPDGCCPLGVALRAANVPLPGWLGAWTAPNENDVSEALVDAFDDRDGWAAESNAVCDRAAEFIADWDAGKIDPADLSSLLEVE